MGECDCGNARQSDFGGKRYGLWRINKESGKLEPFVAEVIKFGVRSLLTDAQGTLYIGSEKGLFVCKNNELEQITINADIGHRIIS